MVAELVYKFQIKKGIYWYFNQNTRLGFVYRCFVFENKWWYLDNDRSKKLLEIDNEVGHSFLTNVKIIIESINHDVKNEKLIFFTRYFFLN